MKTKYSVAIFFGGNSTERNISIQSGYSIFKVLINFNINVYPIDMKYFSLNDFLNIKINKVFISLHGKWGEDGSIQGMLDYFKIPYTGSGLFVSSLSIDKYKINFFLRKFNINVLPNFLLNNIFRINKLKYIYIFNKIIKKISLPFIMKPNCHGSSIGLKLIYNFNDFKKYLSINKSYKDILVEKYIIGDEYTVGIINGKVLCPIKIKYSSNMFDYKTKYIDRNVVYSIYINDFIKKKLIDISINIWNILGCKGCIRIDYIVDKFNNIWFLELNTVPGMTKNSLIPISANYYGISYSDLVLSILYS